MMSSTVRSRSAKWWHELYAYRDKHHAQKRATSALHAGRRKQCRLTWQWREDNIHRVTAGDSQGHRRRSARERVTIGHGNPEAKEQHHQGVCWTNTNLVEAQWHQHRAEDEAVQRNREASSDVQRYGVGVRGTAGVGTGTTTTEAATEGPERLLPGAHIVRWCIRVEGSPADLDRYRQDAMVVLRSRVKAASRKPVNWVIKYYYKRREDNWGL